MLRAQRNHRSLSIRIGRVRRLGTLRRPTRNGLLIETQTISTLWEDELTGQIVFEPNVKEGWEKSVSDFERLWIGQTSVHLNCLRQFAVQRNGLLTD